MGSSTGKPSTLGPKEEEPIGATPYRSSRHIKSQGLQTTNSERNVHLRLFLEPMVMSFLHLSKLQGLQHGVVHATSPVLQLHPESCERFTLLIAVYVRLEFFSSLP